MKSEVIVFSLLLMLVSPSTSTLIHPSLASTSKKVLIDKTHGNGGPGMPVYPGVDLETFSGAAKNLLEYFDYDVTYLYTGPIDESSLAGYDVLWIYPPFSAYSSLEILAILSFVDAGHGLFLVGEWGGYWAFYPNGRGVKNTNDFSHHFGITFDSNAIMDPTDYMIHPWWVRIHVLDTEHPIMTNVSSVQMFTSDTLTVTIIADTIAWGDEDTYVCCWFPDPESLETNPESARGLKTTEVASLDLPADPLNLIAASSYGMGRVVAVTDSDTFSPYEYDSDGLMGLYEEDNERLLVHIMDWLCQLPPDPRPPPDPPTPLPFPPGGEDPGGSFPVPEFPMGAVMEVALLVVVIYVLWSKTKQPKPRFIRK